ncbi:hypothetical protein SLE2022_248610 [Rubroshorea leprosula]
MAQATESRVFLHVYCLLRDTPPEDVAVFDRSNFNFTIQITSYEEKDGIVVSDSVDFVHKMDLSRDRFPPSELHRILGDYLVEIGGPECNVDALLATVIPPIKERIDQDASWRIESVIFCIHRPVRSEDESDSSEGTVLQESVEESEPISKEDEQDSSKARVLRESKEESGGKLISAAKESIGTLERIRITDECAICEKHLAESADLIRIPCSHLFHEGCIVRWLSKSKLCPRCGFAIQTTRPF